MNQSDFTASIDSTASNEFSGVASSHPDKIHVQSDLDINTMIENALKDLKYLETPECKAKMEKEMINEQMKKYTIKFKYLLKLKEIQNAKPKLND